MKFVLIFLLFFDLYQANHDENEAIAQAMCDVIELTHKNENWVLDLIIYGKKTNELKDIANELIKRLNKSKPFVIKHIEKSDEIKLNNSAVILLKSIEILNLFHKIVHIDQYQKENLNFYIYFETFEKFIKGRFFSEGAGHLSHYEYLFFKYEEIEVKLFEHTIFSDYVCKQKHFAQVNVFSIQNKIWKKNLIIKKKYENFYDCQLIFGRVENTLHYHYKRNFSGEIVHFGIIPLMIDAVSKVANYSYEIVDIEVVYNEDNTLKVQNEKIDVTIFQSVMFKNNKINDAPIIDTMELVFIITSGELYTIYEKLFFPFDKITWTLLCLTFATAFIVIFIMQFFKKKFRNLIYGNEIKTPTLNVIGIFFENSMPKLPKKNIARFILILFIGFCLIFRTCYQSKLFDFMTSEMRRPEIQTIDELYEKNYQLFSYKFNFPILQQILHDQSLKVTYLLNDSPNNSSIIMILPKFNAASEKQAVIVGSVDLLQYERFFDTKFKVLKEPLFTFNCVLFMGTNNFYSHIFYKTLRRLLPSGIPQHFTKFHKEIFHKKVEEEVDKEPKVLSMNDLDFGFFIWLPFIGIAIIVFIIELISFKFEIKKSKKKLKKIKFAKVHPMIVVENKKKLKNGSKKLNNQLKVEYKRNLNTKIKTNQILNSECESNKEDPYEFLFGSRQNSSNEMKNSKELKI